MTPSASRRVRSLRRAILVLAGVAVAGVGLGFGLYLKSRPAPYRPDEAVEDITSDLERALPPDAPRPRLTDFTREAGLDGFRNFAGSRTSQLPEDMGPGLAFGDFDNDGDDDLFLVSAGGALGLPTEALEPCALYENLGNATFRRVTAFPDVRIRGLGAAWADSDGDGFLDLTVVGYQALRLYRNAAGTGRFERDDRLPELPGFWSGATWGDFDRDRRPDLYVCNYVQYREDAAESGRWSDQIGTKVPFTLNPASYPGGTNVLFRQNADGSFSDVTAELKVGNPEGRSLGALWHDFDQDGWLDLYVANDVSDNVLYRNVGGRFEDISHPAWVADYRSAMGLAAGDFDRDGDDDLHVTHWVAQENALYDNTWANFNPRSGPGSSNKLDVSGSAAATSGPAGGAKVFPLRFVDIADQKGLGQIALPYVGWGTAWVDLDQDGWLDLLVANGSTLEVDGPEPKRLQPQEPFLFWNRRGNHFHNLAPLHPGLNSRHVSRGLACADVDLDGDVDFVVADLFEGVRLFRNDMAAGNWLSVRLRSRDAGGKALGFGDGSTVIAWVGGVPLRRTVSSASYLSQDSRGLSWGLGQAGRVDRLEVRWHGGETAVFDGIEANASYEIVEGEASVRPLPRRAPPAEPPRSDRADAVAGSLSKAADGAASTNTTAEARRRQLAFWETQRAAMNAMKVDRDNAKAIGLFRKAIALNPAHEDSRYYLGLCLAGLGHAPEALEALAGLQVLNPQSHRAWQQWGVIRATFATSEADLVAAREALERAHRLNPEETGALLVLGEVDLLLGRFGEADTKLEAATRTNPKAVGGFFLRAYLAWKRGDGESAKVMLERARLARGPDWTPAGATAEGDTRRKQHLEATPLTPYWEAWDGSHDPAGAFLDLERRMRPGA